MLKCLNLLTLANPVLALWEISLAAKLLTVSVCFSVLRIIISNPFRNTHLKIYQTSRKFITISLIRSLTVHQMTHCGSNLSVVVPESIPYFIVYLSQQGTLIYKMNILLY